MEVETAHSPPFSRIFIELLSNSPIFFKDVYSFSIAHLARSLGPVLLIREMFRQF